MVKSGTNTHQHGRHLDGKPAEKNDADDTYRSKAANQT